MSLETPLIKLIVVASVLGVALASQHVLEVVLTRP